MVRDKASGSGPQPTSGGPSSFRPTPTPIVDALDGDEPREQVIENAMRLTHMLGASFDAILPQDAIPVIGSVLWLGSTFRTDLCVNWTTATRSTRPLS